MTDNRTTERLMAMLEERGVKHELEHDLYVEWVDARGNDVTAFETSCKHKGDVLIVHVFLTPEQAIAATLGSGTLTAEQVREAVEASTWAETSTIREFNDSSWQAIADELNAELGSEINGETSDGYHTFNELYHHRAVLFSVIVRDHRERAWKARKHHDGTMYEGMFIVGIETPKGQATYHYDLDPYWDIFDCEEREYAPEWDGHTPDDAIARIAELGSGTCKNLSEMNVDGVAGYHFICSECGLSVCASMGVGEIELSGPRSFRWKVDGKYEFERCPRCGRKVKR